MTNTPPDTATDLAVMTRTSDPLGMEPSIAKMAMARYQELKLALLTDDDYQPLKSGRFPKRSAFQKLGNAFNVSTEIRDVLIDRDGEGAVLRARYIVRATKPDGRYAEGDGACSIEEARFARAEGKAKLEHDLPATAKTRATNRAVSDLVAFGAVSAEEATEGDVGEGVAPSKMPPWAQPGDVGAAAQNVERVRVALDVSGEQAQTLGQSVFEFCQGEFPAVAEFLFAKLAELAPEPANAEPMEASA